MYVSLVIPMFNEESNILKLLIEIEIVLKTFNKYEIIIVDDNSSDRSYQKVQEYKNINDKIILFKNKKNFGQSYSITKGIKNSKYDTIITLDADGQNNPKDIMKMIEIFFSDDQLELLGGIRNKRRDNKIKIISSKIANGIRSYILKDNCSDTGCSLKIFKKNTYLDFPYFDGIHRFIPALYSGYNKKTSFVNVDHRERVSGKSNYGTLTRLYKGIIDLIRVVLIIRKKNQ
ncbi:glycosyltransferase family 2 protein [Alphaproteobacteria bacterium]|nr:glycosyltransferase family 2 protein [Alphaproteobacteria bacterium]